MLSTGLMSGRDVVGVDGAAPRRGCLMHTTRYKLEVSSILQSVEHIHMLGTITFLGQNISEFLKVFCFLKYHK